MNKLPLAKRAQVISSLMEGVGVNPTARMTGVSKPTILKLVADLGAAYAELPSARPERKYSPPACTGCYSKRIAGRPDARHVSTSFIESHNQKIRRHNRRLTRLTAGHSKKFENHCHHLAIFFLFYNFARVHSTLRMSPAMAAGIETRLWDVADVVRLMDA